MSQASTLRGTLALVFLVSLPCLVATAEDASAGSVDLSGTWAEMEVCSQLETLPLVGRVTSTSTSVLRVTIEQSGSSLLMREVYCSSTIGTGSVLAKTFIPDAFLISLGEMLRPASLDASGSTIEFVQPWYTQVRGARLSDPENEPLPTSPDDPRVFDQDGDGKPGLTVRVSIMGLISGEVYVVQRVRYRMTGTVVSPDRVEGLIEWTNEQITIAASNPLFAADTRPEPNPAPEKSYFVLQRIDPPAGCEEIVEQLENLLRALDAA